MMLCISKCQKINKITVRRFQQMQSQNENKNKVPRIHTKATLNSRGSLKLKSNTISK